MAKVNLKDASAKEAKAKGAALEAAVTQIERDFGQGSLMRLGDKGTIKVDAILALLAATSIYQLIWLFGRLLERNAGDDARVREDSKGSQWSRAW